MALSISGLSDKLMAEIQTEFGDFPTDEAEIVSRRMTDAFAKAIIEYFVDNAEVDTSVSTTVETTVETDVTTTVVLSTGTGTGTGTGEGTGTGTGSGTLS